MLALPVFLLLALMFVTGKLRISTKEEFRRFWHPRRVLIGRMNEDGEIIMEEFHY